MNTKIDPIYWLKIAQQIGTASTCRLAVGCVLVHKKMIVGHGYVGSIHGDDHCNDDDHILVDAPHRIGQGTTCIRTIHAEVNAILKCPVRGSKANGWLECYCTHQPCLDCTKLLLQVGVRKIYYGIPYADVRREKYLQNVAIGPSFNIPEREDCVEFIEVKS